MRRLILTLSLVPLLAVIAAPSGAAETGAIRGRAINGTSGAPQADLRVVLVGSDADGSDFVRMTDVTDEDGRFAFEDLPTGPDRYYAVQATYDGGLFAGPAQPLPDDTAEPPVYRSTLRVWETTTDPSVVAVVRDDMFVVLEEDEVGVIEAVTVFNASDRAYIGRSLEDDGPSTSLGLALPAGAGFLGADVERPDLLVDRSEDFGVGSLVALPPGERRITYSYSVPGTGGSFDLTRPALYRTAELTVFAAPPLEIESNRLRAAGHITLEGQRYDKWTTTEGLDAADPVQIVATARAGASIGLIGGLAAAGLVVVAAVAIAARRRKEPGPEPAARRPAPPEPGRESLLLDVARLDIAHDAGEISHDEWAARRAELKERLGRSVERVVP